MPAKYLKSASSNAVCPITKMLLTNARTVDNITPIWAHIFSKYFDTSESYTSFHMTEKVPRVPGRKFPAVTYLGGGPAEQRRVVLVEAMDVQGATWDAKVSDVYAVLRGLDAAHGTRKALGVLSAGKSVVLFEVSGAQEPKYLLGTPTAPANLLDVATSLKFEKEVNAIKASAKAGNCKAFVPAPDSATVVVGRASTSGAASSRSGSPAPTSRNGTGTPSTSRSSSPAPRSGTRTSSPAPGQRAASPARTGATATTKSTAARK